MFRIYRKMLKTKKGTYWFNVVTQKANPNEASYCSEREKKKRKEKKQFFPLIRRLFVRAVHSQCRFMSLLH